MLTEDNPGRLNDRTRGDRPLPTERLLRLVGPFRLRHDEGGGGLSDQPYREATK